jgi:hypothetical protein
MVKRGASGGRSAGLEVRVSAALEANVPAANDFGASPRAEAGQTPITKLGLRGQMTLEQACPKEYQGAQCAFKDSMIH